MPEWTNVAGETVGSYVLGEFTGESRGAGVFEVFSASLSGPALLHLIPIANPEAAAREQSFTIASGLEHPNLVHVLDRGRTSVDGEECVYAVVERPEDVVGSVLTDRALDGGEVSAILGGVVPALAYLHERGIVHGAVGPSSIVAVRDTVKLTCDSLARGAADKQRHDVAALGRSIVEMLTTKAGSNVQNLPTPFRQIVAGTTTSDPAAQWTLADVQRALAGEPVPARQMAAETPVEPPQRRNPRVLGIVLAAAAVLAVIVFAVARRSDEPAPASAAPPKRESPAPKPDPRPSALGGPVASRPAEVPKRATPPPAKAATAQAETRSRRPDTGGQQWAVVAAIYKDYDAAERRAARIRNQWSRSDVVVLPPKGEGKRYLVTLGHGLSKEDADRVRSSAVSAGLPRDTYVTKLSIP